MRPLRFIRGWDTNATYTLLVRRWRSLSCFRFTSGSVPADPRLVSCVVCFWRDSLQWARASSFTRFLDHTPRRTTVGRTPLDEWSARRRDLYLTTDNTHNKHAPGGIRTHDLSRWAATVLRLIDRTATGTGSCVVAKGNYVLDLPPSVISLRLDLNIWVLITLGCVLQNQAVELYVS